MGGEDSFFVVPALLGVVFGSVSPESSGFVESLFAVNTLVLLAIALESDFLLHEIKQVDYVVLIL